MIKYLRLQNLAVLFIVFAKTNYAQSPTWSKDVAPILYKNCTSCHHPGALGPNSLMNYQQAFNYRFLIEKYVKDNVMPPWPPDPAYKRLAHERVLSQTDKDIISAWVLNNAPEGNPADAPAAPIYTNTGSQLTAVNFSAKMPDYTVNTNGDLYRCFVINTNFATDKFASEIEVVPGNSSIVHHVLVYEDTTNYVVQLDSADAGPGYTSFFGTGSNDSKLVGEWVPGTGPIKFPSSMGIRLRKNTRLILQIHYPKGTFLKVDSTRVNIRFTEPSNFFIFREVYLLPYISESNLVNGPLVIPPEVVKTFTARALADTLAALPFNAYTLLALAPHMHLIGKKMKVYSVEAGTGDTLPLINIPNWDFKWQGIYNFRSPIKIVEGSTLVAESAYDNTSSNPANPNSPPQLVVQGEATTDEMMLVFFAVTYYLPGDENIVVDNSPMVGLRELSFSNRKDFQILKVYPNPTSEILNLSYFSLHNETAQLRIFSVDGKMIRQTDLSVSEGFRDLIIDTSVLSPGQYFINVQTKTFTHTQTFIKYE